MFDGEAIVFAALLRLALLGLPFIFLAGFVARVENVSDVKGHDKNHDGRIEQGILEWGFRERGSFRVHGICQAILQSV